MRIFAIAALLRIGLSWIAWWKAKNTYWISDETIRAKAQQIDARDIEYIRLSGLHMGYDNEPTQDMTAPTLLEVFLTALRNAEMEKPGPVPEPRLTNRGDQFEIHFRNRPVWWQFVNVNIPEECFGPPFQKALLALGQYRAAQLHTLPREPGKHLKKVSIQSPDDCNVATQYFQTPEDIGKIRRSLTRSMKTPSPIPRGIIAPWALS